MDGIDDRDATFSTIFATNIVTFVRRAETKDLLIAKCCENPRQLVRCPRLINEIVAIRLRG